MALIRPIHGEMSGSIAGNTWSRNRGGQYVRQRRSPSNPNTTRQQQARSYLGSASNLWRSLTDVQRQAWKNWASANPVINRLGQSIQLSGAAAYNMLSTRILDRGGAPASVPPSTAGPVSLATLSVAVSAATGLATLTFTATPIGAGKRIALWSTGAGKPSQDPNYAQARLIGYTAANAASGVTMALPYAVNSGDVINFYATVVQDDGRASVPLKSRCTVTA